MPKPLDLKSTLNLPRTAFPMKANLPQNEPRMLAEWEQGRLYHRIQEARADAPTYVLHDGPPYPTGTIHLGTGLNKILKDMVVKSKTMAGFRAPYVPGMGLPRLPIETQVEKELGGKKGSVPPAEFRRMCREFALRYVDQHRRDFKRLGVLGRWEDPYLTMSHSYEACIAGAFLTFLEKGYVYRGLEAGLLVHSRPHGAGRGRSRIRRSHQPLDLGALPGAGVCRAQPAKSDAEVVRAGLDDHSLDAAGEHGAGVPSGFRLCARGRPTTGDTYIVGRATCSARVRSKRRGLQRRAHAGPFPGTMFARARSSSIRFSIASFPAYSASTSRSSRAAESCTPRPATARRTLPSARNMAWRPMRRSTTTGVSSKACPNTRARRYSRRIPAVIGLLKSRGALVAEGKLQHSYPHCWRCHNPVIFRATEQWFVQMDDGSGHGSRAEGAAVAPAALGRDSQSQWTPAWGRGAHPLHDRRAAGLVHFPPALLGRAADHFLLRCNAASAARRYRGAAPRARLVRARRRRRLVQAHARKNCCRRARAAQMRRGALAQRKRHSRRVVRLRLVASRRARSAGHSPTRTCRGLRICISKVRISIAAGSTARC